jgi:hypothetical protein
MTKAKNDNLFLLIKSLTKSEKRQFKLYVKRIEVNKDSKFLNLFNILDKANTYNEGEILKTGIVKKQQLANVKSHLYKQILISLKLSPSHQDVRFQIREQLDFASILYHKGLYKQSLKILDKAKEVAIFNEEKNLAYEIVELEKIIESQFITRSMTGRAEQLSFEAENLTRLNVTASKLSNLSLELYGIFLKTGYVKNKKEAEEITEYFNNRLPNYNIREFGFREKLWLYKAFLWYSFLLQNFKNCYRYSKKWVNLFHEYPNMVSQHPVFFLKGNNYLLEALFMIGNKDKYGEALQSFIEVQNRTKFPNDKNIETLSFLYTGYGKINHCFIDGSFKEGLGHIPEIKVKLNKFKKHIDEHHQMIFYYKFACLHFGVGNNVKCIFYLDKIISNKSLSMREDLLCFSRILNLLAHYEEGLDYNLESLIRGTYKYLIKLNELYEVQKEIINFIRDLQDIYPHDLKDAFIKLHKNLKRYEDDPFERRSFLYLDILSWLESKIENKPVAKIIEQKYLTKNNLDSI